MRHALIIGLFALAVAGTGTVASASPHRHVSRSTSHASRAAALSPDVTAWTSHLVVASPQHARDGIGRFAGGILARTSKLAAELTRSALRFLGDPYVFGGTSPSGFDCSGYVQHVFAMLGVHLPRTADAQYDVGHPAVGGPRPGDLVFFQTYTEGVSHVGIYLGHGKFVHAASEGVMVSELSQPYWAARYLGAKRYLTRALARRLH